MDVTMHKANFTFWNVAAETRLILRWVYILDIKRLSQDITRILDKNQMSGHKSLLKSAAPGGISWNPHLIFLLKKKNIKFK